MQTARVPEGWSVVEGSKLFNFEKPGDFLKGTLLALTLEPLTDEQTGHKKKVLTAKFEFENGDVYKFRPPYDLREKLGRRHIGRRMYICYDHDDAATAKKGNAMKMFVVAVSPLENEHGAFQGSDEDLPAEVYAD